MKRTLVLIVAVAVLLCPEVASTQEKPDSPAGGMPPPSIPAKPLPHHEPDRPSNAGSYVTQVTRLNDQGVEEAVQLGGLEALMADGLDPLVGNYRLVEQEDVMLSAVQNVPLPIVGVQTRYFKRPSLPLVPGSEMYVSPALNASHDAAAGDLNGDLVDEQIVAWLDPGNKHAYLAAGAMPGTLGRSTSEPAAAAYGDNIDLLVRGYDEALWHADYDGTSWGAWDNNGGGILLSGPAIASRGTGTLDVFVVGTDNQIHQQHWDGAAWSGWTPMPHDTDMPPAPTWTGATPELPAPAAVARGADAFDVFRVAPDRTLRWNHFDGKTWAGWQGLGGMLASGPGAVLLDDGRVQVFAVGVDQALWYLLSEGTGWEMDGPAHNWQRVGLDGMDPGVTPASAPTAVQAATGVVTVFVRGSDDALWQTTYNGTWGSWSKGGGGLASRPAAAVKDDGSVELFAQGADGRLLHSEGGATWGDLDHAWLPACCLERPVDAGLAYVDDAPEAWDLAHNIDVTTAHLSGDGREQIVLAYEVGPSGLTGAPQFIELSIFDRAGGFVAAQRGSISDTGPGGIWVRGDRVENPQVTVGDFDDDPELEIALAYETNTGAVTVFENMQGGDEPTLGRSLSWTWDEDWTEDQGVGHIVNLSDYHNLNDRMSAIVVAGGWAATVYEHADGLGQSFCFGPTGYASFTGDAAMLNDKASSIRIHRGSCDSYTTGSISKARLPMNGHFVIDLFDVGHSGGNWTLTLKSRDMFEGELKGEIGLGCPWLEADRIPKMVSGDFYVESPDQDPAKAELGVILLENLYDEGPGPISGYISHRSRFYMLDYGDNDFERRGYDADRDCDPNSNCITPWYSRFDTQVESGEADVQPIETFLAAGDWDGDGMDEIARTWPTNPDPPWSGDPFGDPRQLQIDRAVQVMENDIDNTYEPLEEEVLKPTTVYSWRDALAMGHIGGNPDAESAGRDLKDKIIFFEGGSVGDSPQSLQVFEYDKDGIPDTLVLSGHDNDLGGPRVFAPHLVPGDYRGTSLRVGSPAFRGQYDIDSVVAIIHAPPKHFDVVNGVTYNVNKDVDETYAMLRRSEGSEVAATLSTTRRWAVDSEYEYNIGDPEGTHLGGSLENTYGEGFSKTYGSFGQVELTSQDNATRDDFVVTAKTGYGVWEYPVYGAGSPGVPNGALSLVFPMQSPATEFHPANSCDNWWYLPRHQLANVWSYPPSGTVFPEEVEQIRPLQNYNAAFTSERAFEFTEVEEAKLSRSVNFSHASETEFQIGGDKVVFGVSGGIFTAQWHTRTPSFRWSTQRSYSTESLSTLRVQTTNETRVEIHNQAIADAAWDYRVEPYVYWADEGYMVLDYKDAATGSAFTNPSGLYGGKPDPAFLLPWMNGSDYGCPSWQWAFSRDIVVYPPVVSAGDTVTVTASVRNLSNWAANDVEVAFYQGDPGAGGVLIGYGEREGAQTMDLGPREVKSMSLSWQPSGYGEQRIYAVIDPDNDLDEIHDETDPAINNNVGYGLLSMGAFDFVDMGLGSRQAYYPLGYTTAGGLGVTAYVPTAILSETVRAELTDARNPPGVPPGNSFRLALYAGSTGWATELTGDALPLSPEDPPLMLMLTYAGPQGAGLRAADLTLYRKGDVGWEDATCPGRETYRFRADNMIAVPVCQTGVFALASDTPLTAVDVFLPLVFQDAP